LPVLVVQRIIESEMWKNEDETDRGGALGCAGADGVWMRETESGDRN